MKNICTVCRHEWDNNTLFFSNKVCSRICADESKKIWCTMCGDGKYRTQCSVCTKYLEKNN